MGHAVISYIAYSAITLVTNGFFNLEYSRAHGDSQTPFILVMLGVAMHFAKAALLSAPVLIENEAKESVGGFVTPLLAVGGTVLTYALSERFDDVSGSKKKALYVAAGMGALLIGMFPGVSAMTSTLGEYIDFDKTLVTLGGPDETWVNWVLHMVGLTRISVGSLLFSSAYLAFSIYNVIYIRSRRNID